MQPSSWLRQRQRQRRWRNSVTAAAVPGPYNLGTYPVWLHIHTIFSLHALVSFIKLVFSPLLSFLFLFFFFLPPLGEVGAVWPELSFSTARDRTWKGDEWIGDHFGGGGGGVVLYVYNTALFWVPTSCIYICSTQVGLRLGHACCNWNCNVTVCFICLICFTPRGGARWILVYWCSCNMHPPRDVLCGLFYSTQ